MYTRRDLFVLTAAITAAGATPALALADPSVTGQPKDGAAAHTLWAKLSGDLSGRTVFSVTEGVVWGFKPQADDIALADFARRFYGYASCSARKMRVLPNGGIAVRSKDWTFYRNPTDGAIIDKLDNPYTKAVDDCPPMSGPSHEQILGAPRQTGAYPVEFAPEQRPYDMRFQRVGGHVWVTTSSFTRLKPGNIGWWKLEGEMDNYHCLARDFDDPSLSHIPNTRAQNLVAEWQTWTKMHGVPGHILFKGDGAPLKDASEIPPDVTAAIQLYFPGTLDETIAWDR